MHRKLFKTLMIIPICLACFFANRTNNAKLENSSVDYFSKVENAISYSGEQSIIDSADVIAVCRIDSIEEHFEEATPYYEYKVSTKNILKGNSIREVKNYIYNYEYSFNDRVKTGQTHYDYKVGQDYLFVLQHVSNVFYDEYSIICDAFLPLTEPESCSILKEKCNVSNILNLVKNSVKMKSEGDGSQYSISYVKSNDKNKIIADSQYIALVQIGDIDAATSVNEIFSCRVINETKGNMTKMGDGSILVAFFPGTVKTGDTVQVCLNSSSKDSVIYTVSSKNSILKKE